MQRVHIFGIVGNNATCLLTDSDGKKRVKKWVKLCRMPIKYKPLSAWVSVIKGAKTNSTLSATQRGSPSGILLFTDDAKLIAPPVFAPPPDDYDVLYFGGRVHTITQHTTNEWKKGVFIDANFVVISKKAYNKILRAVCDTKTLDVILAELADAGKLNTYCLNPQIVSTYSSAKESRTNLYDLTEAVTGYPVAVTTVAEYRNLILVTRLQHGFNETMFTCLLYSLLKDTYPKDRVTWVVSTNENSECFNALANSGIRYKILPDDNVGSVSSVVSASILEDLPPSCVVVNYECGYYYRHNYLSVINSSIQEDSMICAVSTSVYVILTDKVYSFAPVDVSGYPNILIPGMCAYTIDFWRERQFDAHGSLQQFVSKRESRVSTFGDTNLAIKIIGNTDAKLKETDVRIETFYDSEADQTFLECVFHTYN